MKTKGIVTEKMLEKFKEVAKIRAEERARAKEEKAKAKEQTESERLNTLKAEYEQQFEDNKYDLEHFSNSERKAYAYYLSKEIRLNEAKLKDNQKKLVKAGKKVYGVDTLYPPLSVGLSALAGAVLGTELATLATGESPLTIDSNILYNSALVGSMATAGLNAVCEITRPVSKLQRKKAQKNIQKLDMENEYLNKIKNHIIETYGISVPPKEKESTSTCNVYEMEM